MITLEDIIAIGSRELAMVKALELFQFQAVHCAPYREYISLLDIDPKSVTTIEQIPFMPVELFKSHRIYCGSGEPEIVFTSSTTGGGNPSRHHMASTEDYLKACRASWLHGWGGDISQWSFYGLLPSYLERNGSSLVYMVEDFIRAGGGGLYLHNHDALLEDMARDPRPKVLIGVSYALWDLAERGAKLENCIVMETGGMKGRRRELPKAELHQILCDGLGVDRIASEYGMAELTSQAYSKGEGIFLPPPWLRVLVRQAADPLCVATSGRGAVNIIDLTNLSSCAFIQTDDMARVEPDGSFEILGRIDGSEIRGCNLLIE